MTRAAAARQVRQRAAELVPTLKERATVAEQLRRVPPESVQDLVDSGLLRVGNPDGYGGPGLDIDAAFAVAAELGRGCGSTAWCYAVWTAHNWWLGHFPARCQDEYFASGPDVLCSSALNPSKGVAVPVDGGFLVSGRWTFSSGCDSASWVMLACRTGTGTGTGAGAVVWLLLPRESVSVLDTWFAVGLRGTGSKDVLVDNVFVPGHRVISPDDAGVGDRTGWQLHRRASYRAPSKMFVEWALAAPVIGMAQGVVDEFMAQSWRRPVAGTGREVSQTSRRLRLARAAAEVDTARTLHLVRVREIIDRASSGAAFSRLDRARLSRDAAFTVDLCVQAVDGLYAASGARALMEADPVQRLARDVNAAAHHASLGWDAAAERFGGLSLDGPPLPTTRDREE
ncbi:acyl-CoA dehydrogenase family protein [Nocardioides campestrisoli]|uniref:acyl-CoA dehydrogenase family protein n=1 Tax=Nocardioides campestrisoli TaxID=2736757 RepID=UPI00163DD3EE|nr:acyl-CoA dehydrogenase family protein [Nocardioides campestrisoli]